MRPARVVEAFPAYLAAEGLRVTRAELERNLAGKARSRTFLGEVAPMLATKSLISDVKQSGGGVSGSIGFWLDGTAYEGTVLRPLFQVNAMTYKSPYTPDGAYDEQTEGQADNIGDKPIEA